MIDLNAEQFDTSDITIFNDGNVGVVEGVVIKEVKETDPTKGYEITFEKNGGSLRHFVNYFNETDPNAGPIMKAVGIQLKHMLRTLYGENFALPSKDNMHDLIVACMNLVKAKIGVPLRLHVNYGQKTKPSIYMRVHKYSPFMELMSTNPSQLKTDPRFLYERPEIEEKPDSGAALENNSEEIPV